MQRLHYKSRDFFVYRFLSVCRDFTINLETFLYRYFLMYIVTSQYEGFLSTLDTSQVSYFVSSYIQKSFLELDFQRLLSRDFLEVGIFQCRDSKYLSSFIWRTQCLKLLDSFYRDCFIVYSGRDFLVQRFLLSLNL